MPQFTKNLQISPYGYQSPFVIATSTNNGLGKRLKKPGGFYIPHRKLMRFFWGKTAVLYEMANGANLVVAVKRVIAALGNGKRHFLACKFHLQVVVLCFIA